MADGLRVSRIPSSALGRPAVVEGTTVISFGEIARRVDPIRAGLVAHGVGAGSRVAMVAPNRLETALAIYALLDLGATIVPIHPRLTPPEVGVVVADASPHITLRADDVASLAARGCRSEPPVLFPVGSLPLAIVYTSGTTGRPKGAVLSRGAFLASAAASASNLGWSPGDRWLCCLPVCHVGGLSILTRCLLAMQTLILLPRFDPQALLRSIPADGATLLSLVPTMLSILLEQDHHNVLRRLRAVLLGGAATPFALLEECDRRGVRALTTYGLTECCSQVTVQRPSSPYRARRGYGTPLPTAELRLVREDGAPTNPHEPGRILVRGPMLMDGYFRGEGKTPAAPLDESGYFDTGDLGEVDEAGTLFVHARRTDLIVTGGENVYPTEVEHHLESTPGVRGAVVFGIADERWGQLVAVALELSPAADIDSTLAAAAPGLAPHKRPRLGCLVPSLPLTSSGKLDRSGLAERYGAALRPVADRANTPR